MEVRFEAENTRPDRNGDAMSREALEQLADCVGRPVTVGFDHSRTVGTVTKSEVEDDGGCSRLLLTADIRVTELSEELKALIDCGKAFGVPGFYADENAKAKMKAVNMFAVGLTTDPLNDTLDPVKRSD